MISNMNLLELLDDPPIVDTIQQQQRGKGAVQQQHTVQSPIKSEIGNEEEGTVIIICNVPDYDHGPRLAAVFVLHGHGQRGGHRPCATL